MPTVRKVTSKINLKKTITRTDSSGDSPRRITADSVESEVVDEKSSQTRTAAHTKKYCQFCTSKTTPVYWEITALRRFINDRGRIVLRARTGTCSKHQRGVAVEIKHARHLAMLPFTVQV